MAAQRQYEGATVFNARIVDMRHLWVPSNEYMGKPSTKPNYFAMFIAPKTVAQWHLEPVFAGVAAACGKLFQSNPQIVSWPIVDGDVPNPSTGKSSEFAKGHWMFSGSTANPPNVELVQAGGALAKLQNKAGVKSGDYTMVGLTGAVKQTDARAVKFYLNAVVFTAPGEEIVFANSVSGAELMAQAAAQGLRPTGFTGSPGGFGAPQGAGFPGAGAFPGGAGPGGAPGFTPNGPGGFAPGQGNGNPAMFTAPGHGGTVGNGNATFPSNPAGGPFGGAPAAPRGPFG